MELNLDELLHLEYDYIMKLKEASQIYNIDLQKTLKLSIIYLSANKEEKDVDGKDLKTFRLLGELKYIGSNGLVKYKTIQMYSFGKIKSKEKSVIERLHVWKNVEKMVLIFSQLKLVEKMIENEKLLENY